MALDEPTNAPILPGASVLPPMTPKPTTAEQAESAPPGKASKRRHPDRFGVLNGFVDCSMAELSRAEIATWFVLFRDMRNGTACTAATDIARRIGTTKRTALSAIDKLRKQGLVERVRKGGLNRGPSVYRVHPLPREPASKQGHG